MFFMHRYLRRSLAAAQATPLAKWVGLLVMAAVLSGCGQKGGLYMQPPLPAAAPAGAASVPAR